MTAVTPRSSARGPALRTLLRPVTSRTGSDHAVTGRAVLRQQRRASFTFPNPMKTQQEAAKVYLVREEIKTQRYERMMDHFQLRRVVLPHASSNRSLTATTATASPMATAATARLNNTARTHGSAAPSGSRISTQRRASGQFLGPQQLHGEGKQAVKTRFGEPFSPTGRVTVARIVILGVMMTVFMLYLPFTLVHGAKYSIWIEYISVSIATDMTFVCSLLVAANTSTHTSRGQLVTSRRAIWRQYRQHGFTADLLACLPIASTVHHPMWAHSILNFAQLVGRVWVVRCHHIRYRDLHLQTIAGTGKGFFGWMMYSRYSYLVRVACIIAYITLLAHYLACVWTWLNHAHSNDADHHQPNARNSVSDHIHSIYDVLQLLQGQGVETTSTTQDVFASVTVLLGSIALAVVFGHVAILVANFSANDTSYQRKMESVFAVMTKLQLPHPIRERVHQYYEYLHAEYESLDGEVVKFAKDLSHTLELEVVLFKYMDVVMHVPHWRECSPDFQKQLVLHLSVRVYLPDDFIMRRGEVGTECYIINRGTCKLCVYPTGNYDHLTEPLPLDQAPLSQGSLQVKSSSRVSTAREVEPGSVPTISVVQRGQAVGVFALLANYERSCDLRAISYVEMCIIERTIFQKILIRYPRDREITLTNIVGHNIRHTEARGLPCGLMEMVRGVAPNADTTQGIAMLVKAMNPPLSDPSLRFGATENLVHEVRRLIKSRQKTSSPAAQQTCQCEKEIRQLLQQADRVLRKMEAPRQSMHSHSANVGTAHEELKPPRRRRTIRTHSDASFPMRIRRAVRRASDSHIRPIGATSQAAFVDRLQN